MVFSEAMSEPGSSPSPVPPPPAQPRRVGASAARIFGILLALPGLLIFGLSAWERVRGVSSGEVGDLAFILGAPLLGGGAFLITLGEARGRGLPGRRSLWLACLALASALLLIALVTGVRF